jgi:hypothetical protein
MKRNHVDSIVYSAVSGHISLTAEAQPVEGKFLLEEQTFNTGES